MAAAGFPGSLWELICAEYEAEQPQHPDSVKQKEDLLPVDLSKTIFVGKPETLLVEADIRSLIPFSVDESELALTGEWVPSKLPSFLQAQVLPPVSELPSLKTCSPREFLEHFIFPVLLPGMTELLHQAKKEKCFEKKRTKFIALDFLTEWLYNHNPKRNDEPFVEFFEIPFVKDWLKDQPPIPLSLLLSEEEAGIIIQSFWRGYRVRCELEVQELRQWQKHLRETKNITRRVREFWVKQEKKGDRYHVGGHRYHETSYHVQRSRSPPVGAKIEDSARPSPIRSKISVLELPPASAPPITEEKETTPNQH